MIRHWVKVAGTRFISEKNVNAIPILEMDYLKKSINSEYGLLLIENGYVLMDLRLGMGVLKR